MADEGNTSPQPQPQTPEQSLQTEVPQPQNSEQSQSPIVDRTDLLQKARAFLSSPQVRYEDVSAKRRFLAEKGLNDAEIDGLLSSQAPLIPPRTYPQPPPSNLPNLLIGILRIATWVAGGSAALLLVYFKWIYPRLAASFQARHALRAHQKQLLTRLTTSIQSVKETQNEAFAELPLPQLYKDTSQYRDCQTVDEIVSLAGESREIPHITLLRCVIQDLSSKGDKTTTEAIFGFLEAKLPWLATEEGMPTEESLWKTLSETPIFESQEVDGTKTWAYNPPEPPAPPPLVSSLSALQKSIPEVKTSAISKFQHTFQALSDFTGYIASQMYTTPSTYRVGIPGVDMSLSPQEEEVRREIRALKGLVLNRRSFIPSTSRPPSVASLSGLGIAPVPTP